MSAENEKKWIELNALRFEAAWSADRITKLEGTTDPLKYCRRGSYQAQQAALQTEIAELEAETLEREVRLIDQNGQPVSGLFLYGLPGASTFVYTGDPPSNVLRLPALAEGETPDGVAYLDGIGRQQVAVSPTATEVVVPAST